jgi:type IV fimbrial biogenesis protein FimT
VLIRIPERGVTLIELMVGLAIVALVLFVAVPSFGIFLQNSQIKNAASSVLDGLQLARNEAIRRNAPVQFEFVTDLTASCTASPLSPNAASLAWVVSQADPAGACDVAPSETVAPQIIQSRSGTEGTSNARAYVNGSATAVFNGLGRVQGAGITQVIIRNTSGTCEDEDTTNGTMRCMHIVVSPGGDARMCDPKVTDATDPRKCP